MASFSGPKIEVADSLLIFDTKSVKSYPDVPSFADHGISDWYCFVSGTVEYSAIYKNTKIIQIASDGKETVVVNTGSSPTTGTFSATAGARYYGTKAIYLVGSAANTNHIISPVSFAGIYFAHYWTRYGTETYYIYSPQGDASVQYFDNVPGGTTGTATATYSISKGSSYSFSTTTVGWDCFKSDRPIIITAAGATGDQTILAPAAQYVYKRRNQLNLTNSGTTPSTVSTYVTYDTTHLSSVLEIADGAGGDCTQGIGYEYLSDTYSFPGTLSDYFIIAPYSSTTVKVSYWANSRWNLGETHSFNGSQTSPAVVLRDGNNGFGVNGSNLSGAAANLASGATLWKFEGSQPFALVINDSSDEEERLLGWMKNSHKRKSSNTSQTFRNLSKQNNSETNLKIKNRKLSKNITYASNTLHSSDFLSFNGSDGQVLILGTDYSWGNDNTWEAWVNRTSSINGYNMFMGDYLPYFALNSSNQVHFSDYIGSNQRNVYSTGITIQNNTWYHLAFTAEYDGSANTTMKIYINGVLNNSASWAGTQAASYSTSNFTIGDGRSDATWYPFNGKVAGVKLYTKALTATQVKRNFMAQRMRFELMGDVPEITESGLVLNLDAGDSSSYPGSGTTWSDLSGNGNNATLINGPTYSSAYGGSIVFDGTDDYAALGSGSLVNGLTDITLEVWFKADSTGTNRALIYGDANDSLSYDNGCSLRYDSAGKWGGGTNVIKTGLGQNGAANISSSANAIESSSNIQTTGWTCITVTADVGSSISLYKNGQLDTPTYSISNKETSISNCTNFVIGKDGGGSSGGNYWDGSISIVRVYNRVLSASEVQQNFDALRSRFGI